MNHEEWFQEEACTSQEAKLQVDQPQFFCQFKDVSELVTPAGSDPSGQSIWFSHSDKMDLWSEACVEGLGTSHLGLIKFKC